MKAINRLGLQVAGITAVVLAVLFGLYWGGRALFLKDKEAPEQGAGEEQLAQQQKDSDGDGVADLFETTYYKTDPNNPDTDGDGVSDLDEIVAGRDPLIPGPNDESKPATGSQVTEAKTFTQRYLAGLPDDAAREDILDQAKLRAFVEANRGTLMPTITADMIMTTQEAGKGAVATYLDNISSTHNNSLKEITSADIEAAFRLQVNDQNKQPMSDIVTALTNNVTTLKAVATPAEAVDMHLKLIAASQALRDNADLLSRVDQDFVGALIAAQNIEDLGAVFRELASEVKALEGKYGLE
ncbi:MAG: hypothetical protein ABIH36_01090 [bacterium]